VGRPAPRSGARVVRSGRSGRAMPMLCVALMALPTRAGASITSDVLALTAASVDCASGVRAGRVEQGSHHHQRECRHSTTVRGPSP